MYQGRTGPLWLTPRPPLGTVLVVGRASNRKNAQRQAGQKPQPGAVTQEALLKVLTGLQALVEEGEVRREREATARWIWSGGAEPVPAVVPAWHEDSLGDRFCGGAFLREARNAPCLATAEIPDAAMEQFGTDRDVPEFPEQDGPVFMLGVCALMDALWAVVGQDSLSEIQGVLLPALHDGLPSLDSQAAADALIGAFAKHYQCAQPGDAELLERIGDVEGDALVSLATPAP